MRDITISEIERLQAQADEVEVAFQMDEDAFHAFYERTSRPLWAYLSRVSGDRQLADDLLQEAYYRFLKAGASFDSDIHRRNSLFLIATNLVRDRHRRRRLDETPLTDQNEGHATGHRHADAERRAEQRAEVSRALLRLKPRERMMLWLAYAQGSSHREIAAALALETGSIKLLLFRARRKLAGLLREHASQGGRS